MNFQPRYLSNGRICCSRADALCDTCKATEEDTMPSVLRAAHDAYQANPAVSFESHLKILGEARIQDDARRRSAAHPPARLTAAEEAEMLSSYAAPNGYEAGLKALREKEAKNDAC
jgi:hypothetical protein